MVFVFSSQIVLPTIGLFLGGFGGSEKSRLSCVEDQTSAAA